MELLDNVMRLMRPESSVLAAQAQKQQQQGSQLLPRLAWGNSTTSGTASDLTSVPCIATDCMGTGEKKLSHAVVHVMQAVDSASNLEYLLVPCYAHAMCLLCACLACRALARLLSGCQIYRQEDDTSNGAGLSMLDTSDGSHSHKTLLADPADESTKGTLSSSGTEHPGRTSPDSSSQGEEHARVSKSFTRHGNIKWLISINQLVRMSQGLPR